MIFTARFTLNGVAATGLTPTITINKVSDGSAVVTAQAMTELANGWYKYSYAGYDAAEDYVFSCDGGATLSGAERYPGGATDTHGSVTQVLADTALALPQAAPGAVGGLPTCALNGYWGDIVLAQAVHTIAFGQGVVSRPNPIFVSLYMDVFPAGAAGNTRINMSGYESCVGMLLFCSNWLDCYRIVSATGTYFDLDKPLHSANEGSGFVLLPDANALLVSGEVPTVEQIRAEVDSNSTQLAAIVADTGELQTNQGNWLTATGFATASALSAVATSLARAIGLMQENYYLDQAVYSGSKLTSGRLRTYSVAASVGTDSDVLATYTITATWDGSNLETYAVEKV